MYSFFKSLQQATVGAVSPKAILSQSIATALNEYFVIDPALIESNLLTDTKIVLRNIQLKPISLLQFVPPSTATTVATPTDDDTRSATGTSSNNNEWCNDSTKNEEANISNNTTNKHHTAKTANHHTLELIGSVHEIEFKWTWGSATDGSTSFVSDTQLTIRGGKFSIVSSASLSSSSSSSSLSEPHNTTDTRKDCFQGQRNVRVDDNCTGPTSTTTNSINKDKGYMEKYLQQILDHLTLIITDIEIIVDVKTISNHILVLGVHEIELVSFGHSTTTTCSSSSNNSSSTTTTQQTATVRQDNNNTTIPCEEKIQQLLSQRLSIGLIRGDIKEVTRPEHSTWNETKTITTTTTTTSIPCFEIIGYVAMIKRSSGKRFVGSIWNGLQVIGETVSLSSSSSSLLSPRNIGKKSSNKNTKTVNDRIYIHGGKTQIVILLTIFKKLLAIVSLDTIHQDDSITMNANNNIEIEETKANAPLVVDNDNIQVSTFHLEFPCLHISLPNGSSIEIPCGVVVYHADGSKFYITGKNGIFINDTHHPFFDWTPKTSTTTSSSTTTTVTTMNTNDDSTMLSSSWEWHIDLIQKIFLFRNTLLDDDLTLNDDGGSSTYTSLSLPTGQDIASLYWKENEVNHLLHGFYEAFDLVRSEKLVQDLILQNKNQDTPTTKPAATTPSKVQQTMSIIIPGNIKIIMEADHQQQQQMSNNDQNNSIDFIEIVMKPITTKFDENMKTVSIVGHGISLTKSSFDQLIVMVPKFELFVSLLDDNKNSNNHNSNTKYSSMTIADVITLQVESSTSLTNLQSFITRMVTKYFDLQSNDGKEVDAEIEVAPIASDDLMKIMNMIQVPIPIHFSEVRLLLIQPFFQIVIAGVSAKQDNTIRIEQVNVEGGDGTSVVVVGTVVNNTSINVAQIQSFDVPVIGMLAAPVNNVSITYNNMRMEISVPFIDLHLFMEDNTKKSATGTETPVLDSDQSRFKSVPFTIDVFLDKTIIRTSKDNVTEMDGIVICSKPTQSPLNMSNLSLITTAMETEITIRHLQNNDLVELSNLHGIGIYDFYDERHIVHNSYLNVDNVSVVAGFSTVDWKAMVGKGPENKRVPLKLPYTQLASFTVFVEYKGKLIKTEQTRIDIPAFTGDDSTTSDDVFQHIAVNIMTKAPSFLTNSEFLGFNVRDGIATSAGRTLLGTSVAGTMGGSIVGVVAVDAVKGAVSAGKKERGATKDDTYRFGDFTRGIIRTIRETPEAGASGTLNSVGQYAGENKSRLAGAGGSGLGMVIGTAVAGPVGFLVGSVIGNMAGSKAVGVLDTKSTEPQQQVNSMETTPYQAQGVTLSRSDCQAGSNDFYSSNQQEYDNFSQYYSTCSGPAIQFPDTSNSLAIEQCANQTASIQHGSSIQNYHDPNSVEIAQAQLYHNNQQNIPQHSLTIEHCANQIAYMQHGSSIQNDNDPNRVEFAQAQLYHHNQQSIPQHNNNEFASMHTMRSTSQQYVSEMNNNNNTTSGSGNNGSFRNNIVASTPPTEDNKGYKFGSITKSIIEKGKQKRGQHTKDGYKFGDFTRGLFG